MEKKEGELKWFPLWVEKWLWGSTRIELQPDERSVWVDLLAIAAKDNGHIRANVGVPYPIQQLAGMLMITSDLLERTIQRCIETGKLRRDENGCLYVVNWEEYQFTDRYKRMLAARARKEEIGSVDASPHTPLKDKEHNIIEHNRGSENRNSISAKAEITFDWKDSLFYGIEEKDLILWGEAFPACDIRIELLKMASWLQANPTKRKSNYRRFIRNWLSRTQDDGGTAKGKKAPAGDFNWETARKVGTNTKATNQEFWKARAAKEAEFKKQFTDDLAKAQEALAAWSQKWHEEHP